MAILSVIKRCAQDAAPCGPHIVAQMETLVNSYIHNHSHTNCAILLIKYANEAIATYPYAQVPDHWRRLYMDATLLLVALELQQSPHINIMQNHDLLLNLVKKLDTANIVTAYFANGRREAFFELLEQVQKRIDTNLFKVNGEDARPAKRRRLDAKAPSPVNRNYSLPPHIAQIKRYTTDTAPSFEDLQSHSNAPFIITGGITHWPALSDPSTNWKDANYLLKVAGRGRIVPVEIGKSYTSQGWTQKMVSFEEFLDRINWSNNNDDVANDDPPMYLAQHDLFQQFPSLLSDIIPPDYVFSELSPPPEHHSKEEYKPPNVDAGYTINAWMGPKGTYSPAHTDPFYNCYAQVVGVKHIWIAPPECSAFLLPRSPNGEAKDDTSTPQDVSSKKKHDNDNDDDGPDPDGDPDDEPSNSAAQQFMDNTTAVDVFELANNKRQTPSDLTEDERNPLLQKAMQAILQEGDLLFMPPKWWHAIKSLERSFSVSMWF